MKLRLANWSVALFIVVGTSLTLYSSFSQASSAQSIGVESVSPVETLAEQREQLLAEYSQNDGLPLVQRTAATANLGMYYGPNSIIAVARASRSEHPEMRLAAIQAALQWQGKAKWDVVSPLLDDEERDVNAQAVRTLIVLWPQLSGEYLDHLGQAVDRHLTLLPNDLDGDLERAWIYTLQSKFNQAELIYSDRFENNKEPRVAIAYSEYLKSMDDDNQAQYVLTQALIEFPESAALHYSLGLSYLRTHERVNALRHLRNAYDLAPANGSYGYTYATLARENDVETAITVYQDIYQNHAQPAYLYALCDTLLVAGKDATSCLTELESVVPQDVVSKLKKLYLPN